MKHLYYVLAVMLLPCFAQAQANYRDGYIIKNNGDTIKGQINLRDWLYNPQTIEFRSAGDAGNPATFSATDIKEFSAGKNITYVSHTGRISKNKNVYPGLDIGIDSTTIAGTFFLKQLVAARQIELFMLTSENKSTFFYSERNTPPVELKYYQYYTDNSKTSIQKTGSYTYQLIFLAKKYWEDSVPSNAALQRIAYSEKELTRFFKQLNNYQPESTGNTNVKFFAGLGINLNQVSPTVINPPTVTTAFRFSNNVVSSISPKLNLGIDIPITPNTNRYIFRSEASFTYLKTEIAGQHLTPQGKEIKHTYNLSQYTATLSPQLIINLYNADNLKYFIGGGVNANFSIYPHKQLFYEDGKILDDTEFAVRDRTVWLSFPIQTGAVLNNRIEVSAGYWLSSTFADSRYFSLRNPGFTAGVKYFFGAK